MPTRETTRPIVSLMTHVASDLAYLVQTEFRLARAEMGEKLSVASNAGAYLAAGGVVALGGLIALLFDSLSQGSSTPSDPSPAPSGVDRVQGGRHRGRGHRGRKARVRSHSFLKLTRARPLQGPRSPPRRCRASSATRPGTSSTATL